MDRKRRGDQRSLESAVRCDLSLTPRIDEVGLIVTPGLVA